MTDSASTANEVKVEALSGYVEKKNKYGAWQKRYFVLYHNDHTLSYFPDDKKELGGYAVELNLCQVNLIQVDYKTMTLHRHDGQKYKLRFGQESEAKKWKDKLYEVTIRVHPESQGLTAPVPSAGLASSPAGRQKTLAPGAVAAAVARSNSGAQENPGGSNGGGNGGASSGSRPGPSDAGASSGTRVADSLASPTAGASAASAGGGVEGSSGSIGTGGVGGGGSVASSSSSSSSSGGGAPFGHGSGRRSSGGRKESLLASVSKQCWLAFSLFSLGAGFLVVIPVPTLDLWFFKVFVHGGVLHGTALYFLTFCALASLGAHVTSSSSSSHRRSSSSSSRWYLEAHAAAGFCFTLAALLVALPTLANLPLAWRLPEQVDAFLDAGGLLAQQQPLASSPGAAATEGQGAAGARPPALPAAFSFGEYLVDPPCALANVWEYYPHTSEIVFKTTPKPSSSSSSSSSSSPPAEDWSGFGGLSSRNDSDTKLRLAIFGVGSGMVGSEGGNGDVGSGSGGGGVCGGDPSSPSSSSLCPSSPMDPFSSYSPQSASSSSPLASATAQEQQQQQSTPSSSPRRNNNKKKKKGAPLKPVVVSFHGGGWYRGSLYDGLQCYLPAALQQGAAVVAAEYRSGSAGWRGRAMVEDAVDALKWVQAQGPRHGLDPTKVVVTGGSAGAHVGLLAAYLHNKRLKGQPGSIRAVVARYGATGNLTRALASPSRLPRGLGDVFFPTPGDAAGAGSSSSSSSSSTTTDGTAAAAAQAVVGSRGWSEKEALEHIAGKGAAKQRGSSGSRVAGGGGGRSSGQQGSSPPSSSSSDVDFEELEWLSVPSHVSEWTPPTVLLHCKQDEFYDANMHAFGLAEALARAGRPHLAITPALHSHGCDIGSTAPFQFLRYALTSLLRALHN